MKTTKVSATAMSNFLSCKRKYYYYKTEKFEGAIAFEFGKAFEYGLEHYVKNGVKEEAIIEAVNKFNDSNLYDITYTELENKEILKGNDVLDKIVINYLTEQTVSIVNENKQLLPALVERLIDYIDTNKIIISQMQVTTIATLENGNTNEIRIDGLCTKDGKEYIFELKSYKMFKSEEGLKHDIQLLNYMSVMRHKGAPVEGVLFLQVKKAIPEEVKLLKNGKLSTAKTQKCLPEEYWAKAVEVYGSEQDIPEDVLETYTELLNKTDYIKESIVTFSDKELDKYWNQLKYLSEDMAEINHLIQDDPSLAFDKSFPSYGFSCNMCNYKLKCWK